MVWTHDGTQRSNTAAEGAAGVSPWASETEAHFQVIADNDRRNAERQQAHADHVAQSSVAAAQASAQLDAWARRPIASGPGLIEGVQIGLRSLKRSPESIAELLVSIRDDLTESRSAWDAAKSILGTLIDLIIELLFVFFAGPPILVLSFFFACVRFAFKVLVRATVAGGILWMVCFALSKALAPASVPLFAKTIAESPIAGSFAYMDKAIGWMFEVGWKAMDILY